MISDEVIAAAAAEAQVEVPETAKVFDEATVEALRAELSESQRRYKELEVAAVRTRAALRYSLPDSLQEFLTGEDEASAMAQAAKLAAGLKVVQLPPAGGRNPANGGEQAARLDEQDRFNEMTRRVPALSGRVLRS